MKRLVFPPQVKEIGINSFFSCGELKEVIFNEGLETIQRGAFRGCPRLTEIHLPTSIKKVGPEAFLCEVLREGIQDINVNMSTIPEDFVFTLETCRHRDVLMSILTIRTEFLILFCRTAFLL